MVSPYVYVSMDLKYIFLLFGAKQSYEFRPLFYPITILFTILHLFRFLFFLFIDPRMVKGSISMTGGFGFRSDIDSDPEPVP